METPTTSFETAVCSRCNGTGQYSYCQRFGRVCFKCGGTKRVYTARGLAAKKFFDSLLSKPARDLKPGDKIREKSITGVGDMYAAWFEIVEITPPSTRHLVNGEWVAMGMDLRCTSKIGPMTFCSVMPDAIHRVAADAETKKAAMTKAMEYQSTLTKAGTPRKR